MHTYLEKLHLLNELHYMIVRARSIGHILAHTPCKYLHNQHNTLLTTLTCTKWGQLCTWAQCPQHAYAYIVSMVDGCGYDGQQKFTICDACRLCHLILSIVKPNFRWIQQTCCTYISLRVQYLLIWQYLCLWWHWTTTTTEVILLMYVR